MEKLYNHALKKQLEEQNRIVQAQARELEAQRDALEAQRGRVEVLEQHVRSADKAGAPLASPGRPGEAGGHSVVNHTVVNTVVHNTTNNIVFNLAGSADMSALDRPWVQRTLERPSEVGDVLEEAFAVVYCNPETPENHVYYITNSKDLSKTLERRPDGWRLVPTRVALGKAHRRLLGRLLDNQPTNVTKAKITAPKVAELIDLEGAVLPAKLLGRYAKGLAAHPHGTLTKVEIRAASGARAGAAAARASPRGAAAPAGEDRPHKNTDDFGGALDDAFRD